MSRLQAILRRHYIHHVRAVVRPELTSPRGQRRVLPPGEYNVMIVEPLFVYYQSFTTTVLTVFVARCYAKYFFTVV